MQTVSGAAIHRSRRHAEAQRSALALVRLLGLCIRKSSFFSRTRGDPGPFIHLDLTLGNVLHFTFFFFDSSSGVLEVRDQSEAQRLGFVENVSNGNT